MKVRHFTQFFHWIHILILGIFLMVHPAQAVELPTALQTKVAKCQKLLIDWATHPLVISATKEANAKGGIFPGMTNAKWNDLEDNDPVVRASMNSPVGVQIHKWSQDPNINKLFLRDAKANLIAGSSKTLLFNNASRTVATNALKGLIWADDKVKPDPTTQVNSVQVSVPVLDGKKVIGFLHTSVTAD